MLFATAFTGFSQLPKPSLNNKGQRFMYCNACSSRKVPVSSSSSKPSGLLVCSSCEETVGPVKVNGTEYNLPRLDHFHLPRFLGLDRTKTWRIDGLDEWKDITIHGLEEEEEEEEDRVRIFDGSCNICDHTFLSGMVYMCDTCEDFHFCASHGHDKRHKFYLVENVNTGLMAFDGTDGEELVAGGGSKNIPTNFNALVRGLLLSEVADPDSIHVKRRGDEFVIDASQINPDRTKTIECVSKVLGEWNREWFGSYGEIDKLVDFLKNCKTLQSALNFEPILPPPAKPDFPEDEKRRICRVFEENPNISARFRAEFCEPVEIPEGLDEIEIPVWDLSYEQWSALAARIPVWLYEEDERARVLRDYEAFIAEEAGRKEEKKVKKPKKKKKESKKRRRQEEEKKKLVNMKKYNSKDPKQVAHLAGLMRGVLDKINDKKDELRDMELKLNGKVTVAEMNVPDVNDEYRLLDPHELCEKMRRMEEDSSNDPDEILGPDN